MHNKEKLGVAETLALFAVAVAAVSFVAGGPPLLRHDWFPIVPSLSYAIESLTGWDPTGMGSVVGYPASFLLVLARSAVAAAAGPYVAHMAYSVGYELLLVFGAARLTAVLGGSPLGRVAAALFAAFNPWTYAQLVAGHSFMLLSYGATFWLIAECCARYRSPLRLVLLALAVAPQVQFLIVDSIFYAWLSVRMRSWVVVSAIAAMLLPVFVGVLVTRDVLVGTPLTLEWERGESLDPFRATVLRGYFTGYDTVLPHFYEWTQWVIVTLACIGVLTILIYQRSRSWLIGFTAIPLIWSFGVIGPLGAFFSWAITHVSEAGLFRELYDLLGFVAVGYVAFCAIATGRWRRLDTVWFGAAALMLVAWFVAPPQRYWLTSQSLPVTQVADPPNSRFLLTPALYPARLGDRGSGVDPDLYPRAGNVSPVNEAIPMYPLSAAIGRYLRDGSVDGLAALSVERVVARPWLQTDPSIRFQLAFPLPSWLGKSGTSSAELSRVTPELTLGALPAVGTLDSNVGAGNVLFGDARDVTGSSVPAAWRAFDPVLSIRPDIDFVRAADGWVDARLAFVEDPDLAQSYGGAVTTDSAAFLSVVPGMNALVFVRGKLSGQNGETIVAGDGGYRWVLVPASVSKVSCSGLCVVAAEAARIPNVPLDPPSRPAEGVSFRTPIPWLVSATLPVGSSPLLRYNVTFDSKWLALYGGAVLPHVRIDGAVNGWLVPARDRPANVILIEVGAALTTLSEMAGSLGIGCLILYALRRRENARALPMTVTATSERTI